MSKLLIRLTVVSVALYLVICYVVAMAFGIDIWSQTYYLLFELCVCLCISKQGVYHCKYIKYTAYGIFLSDSIVCIDNFTNAFPAPYLAFIPLILISIGLLTTTILATRHYIRVKRLKKHGRFVQKAVPPTTQESSR